ncbi:MAG: S8 family serine peptidase, partial [Thermoplasmatota archaeon]
MLLSATPLFADAAEPEKINVLVGFEGAPNAALIRAHGGHVHHQYSITNAIAAELPEKAAAALENNPQVSYVEVDKQVQLYAEELPWGIDRVDAEVVWGGSDGSTVIASGAVTGSGVNVAVLDTGIDYTHPDLDDNY